MRIRIRNPFLKPTTTLYTTKKGLVALPLFLFIFTFIEQTYNIYIYYS